MELTHQRFCCILRAKGSHKANPYSGLKLMAKRNTNAVTRSIFDCYFLYLAGIFFSYPPGKFLPSFKPYFKHHFLGEPALALPQHSGPSASFVSSLTVLLLSVYSSQCREDRNYFPTHLYIYSS